MVELEREISLNIPSSLLVNWQPHSVWVKEDKVASHTHCSTVQASIAASELCTFNFDIMLFSKSSDTDLLRSSRLAKCCL